MIMYGKDDVTRFISIKCNCSIKEAKHMLDAFYEFVTYTLEHGDKVSCQPLGIFSFRNINARKYKMPIFNIKTRRCEIIEGEVVPFSAVRFKVNKDLYRRIKKSTRNNQFNLEDDIDEEVVEDEEYGS